MDHLEGAGLQRADLPCSSALRARQRRSGRKMLVQRPDPRDIHASRYATLGMSVEDDWRYGALPFIRDLEAAKMNFTNL